jgi:hypothetical protein
MLGVSKIKNNKYKTSLVMLEVSKIKNNKYKTSSVISLTGQNHIN